MQEAGDTYDTARPLASETRTFFTCVMFLTRLPCPVWADHHPAFLMRSMAYFPAIGLAIGMWGAVWYRAASSLWGPHVAATVSTAATVWLTGCFHEDGFADTVDGFGGGWGRSQILRIMKDSRVGTYGCVGTVLALMIKVQALAMLGVAGGSGGAVATGAVRALMVGHCLSRWVSLPLLYFSHYIQVRPISMRWTLPLGSVGCMILKYTVNWMITESTSTEQGTLRGTSVICWLSSPTNSDKNQRWLG
jgi:cobalamin synthase